MFFLFVFLHYDTPCVKKKERKGCSAQQWLFFVIKWNFAKLRLIYILCLVTLAGSVRKIKNSL